MGQKVHPVGMRVGITHTWPSRWFAEKRSYGAMVLLDHKIRSYLQKKLKEAGIARIEIERSNKSTHVSLFTARPGVIIGRQGNQVEELKKDLKRMFHQDFELAIKEIKKPDLEAELVAESIAQQLEKRVAFRRAAKMAIQKASEAGAQGIKVAVAGRLGGAGIARNEFFLDGKIPLHTFRADISYSETRARTAYGLIGVKVWIYRGEIFKNKKGQSAPSEEKALTA